MPKTEIISRTQQKKEVRKLQRLGEEMVGLAAERLRKIDMPADLLDAVLQAKTMKKHGARRRQILHIGSLLRSVDVEPILQEFKRMADGDHLSAVRAGQLRDRAERLAAMDEDTLAIVVSEYPHADIQRIRNLVRNANKEALQETPQHAKAFQKLLDYLKELSVSKTPPAGMD
ncbi:MAG: DUF615 domain-containing protein [Desulfobacteraceae bacterium]|nr:DUF615 domain-containing protein [Desulfobacteraceae bacterium]